MSITLDDLPTLLALLDKHPEWREALRAVLLSEELLKMPEELRRLERVIAKILEAHRLGEEALAAFRMESERRFMELAGALTRLSEMQNRLSEVQARMEERMTRLEERVGRLEEAVARLIEVQARMEERMTRLEERVGHLEERVGRLEEAVARLIEVQARMEERMTRLEERMIRMEERILRRLNAFGARWGLRSERAWREGMRAVLEEAGFEVERWTDFDERGEVFNFPSDVEVDVVIRNGRVLVVELRTSVSRDALPTMERKVRFYEGRTGRKVDRRILVTPWYDPGVDELARRLGWELYGEPEEIQE
ncbi:DUF3782 domain-containing protein [Thermoflexus sp.]|uniref:PD-(D/E)XK nuclease family protein n=1 Tax=Thermoflexus sp. TaxID=1969742 RepID=UPI00262BC630|nr:DUF3782 domain-containing protein [Thermoflexus sp.]MCX7690415.1 DUF3782 domain-containing protein [Thermoflexus sp.]